MKPWVCIPLLAVATFSGAPTPAVAAEPTELYLAPFSHLDYFWGGTREECLARGNRIIAKAIAIAKRQPEFRFLIEDNDFIANYVETHPASAEVAELKRLVKAGRIEIAPKWAAIYQNLPDGEAQVRNLAIGKRYARTVFGVDPQVAHMGDLPGYTPQFPQVLAKAGVRSMVMTRMGPADAPLFHWRAPEGSRVLVWGGGHYGLATRFGFHTTLDDAKRTALLSQLKQLGGAGGPAYMSWGSDLWAPSEKIVENVASLNQPGSSLRVILATPSDFFRRAAQTPSIPEKAGEIPSSWPNLLSSVLNIWEKIVPATNTLLNAEKFAAINYAMGIADYPSEQFEFLWRKTLEAMDHNQDGQGGMLGDERKIEYLQLPLLQGGEILRESLRNIAERVRLAVPNSHAIVVFNPSGWSRTDLVQAHVALFGDVAPSDLGAYKRGMRLVDGSGKALPLHIEQYSENISRSLSLAFVAPDVPAMGYRTFYLVPDENPPAFPKASKIERDDAKDQRDPRRPLGSDVIENEFYRVSLDKATGRLSIFDKALRRAVADGLEVVGLEERGGNYIGVEPMTGRSIPNLILRVEVVEDNAVRTVLRTEGRIADIPVEQRITLFRGMKRVDIQNSVEWKAPRLVRIRQVFPLRDPAMEIRYGVPFGSNAASNILPKAGPHVRDEITHEAWLRSRDIQNWISVGNSASTTVISSDHQQWKLEEGALAAEMVRGTRFTSVRVVTDGRMGSMNYPPPGVYTFRYSITSGAGDWKAAKAWRTGMDFNNPLAPVGVHDEISAKSLPDASSLCSVSSGNQVISALKKADSGPRLVVRLYEIEGEAAEAKLELLGKARALTETNLLEEPAGGAARQTLAVRPFEIKTATLPARDPR
jgi:alpha-mannosidase